MLGDYKFKKKCHFTMYSEKEKRLTKITCKFEMTSIQYLFHNIVKEPEIGLEYITELFVLLPGGMCSSKLNQVHNHNSHFRIQFLIAGFIFPLQTVCSVFTLFQCQ